MLYVSSRTKDETYTVSHPLNQDRSPDGGFFCPMRLPELTQEQILDLGKDSFSANVAKVVNLLFGTKLDSWAIEFAIGRYPVKIQNVGNRTLIAETWHNPAWHFERLARGIEKAIRQSDSICPIPTDWVIMGARIGVLFGVFGDLLAKKVASPDNPIDVVVPTGDFAAPMACWYARKLGLPIHNIVSCCNDNAAAWNLIHKGELRTDIAYVKTDTPLCDHALPAGLERLVFETLGMEETQKYQDTCNRGGNYYLEPHQLKILREGLYSAVVSKRQHEAALTSLYTSYGYLADPYAGLCVAGIGAYRSKAGESRVALVISEESPKHHINSLARTLNVAAAKLKETID